LSINYFEVHSFGGQKKLNFDRIVKTEQKK
jgi:hypothetical protein